MKQISEKKNPRKKPGVVFDFEHMDIEKYRTDEVCLEFIAGQKWKDGYVCRNCGNTNYCRGKTAYSRRCTRCKHEESATAHTLFHRCHIPVHEAFRLVYAVCHDPRISTYELSRQIDRRQMTCWKLKNRLMECIEQRGKVDILFTNEEKPSGRQN